MWTLFGANTIVTVELLLASTVVGIIAYLLTNDVKMSVVVGLVQALASFSVTCAMRGTPAQQQASQAPAAPGGAIFPA